MTCFRRLNHNGIYHGFFDIQLLHLILKWANEQFMWQTITSFYFVMFGYLLKGVITDDFSSNILGAKLSPFQLFIVFIFFVYIYL